MHFPKKYFLTGFTLLLVFSCTNTNFFEKNQKILFLGDSITQQGDYIRVIDAFLKKEKPELALKLVNAGLNSETVSGLSEPIHDPPRPFLFDRLNKILDAEQPDWVFFCYGINDGIYHPYAEGNFQNYKNGVLRFLNEMEKRKIQVILLTPTPFALKAENKAILKDNGNTNYSWKNPYHDYDAAVIQKYRDYILSVEHHSVKAVVNTYDLVAKNKDIAYGADAIHPNAKGHDLIAKAIIQAILK